jgi:hypothetical protein
MPNRPLDHFAVNGPLAGSFHGSLEFQTVLASNVTIFSFNDPNDAHIFSAFFLFQIVFSASVWFQIGLIND